MVFRFWLMEIRFVRKGEEWRRLWKNEDFTILNQKMTVEKKRKWLIRRAWKASWGSYPGTDSTRRPGDE